MTFTVACVTILQQRPDDIFDFWKGYWDAWLRFRLCEMRAHNNPMPELIVEKGMRLGLENPYEIMYTDQGQLATDNIPRREIKNACSFLLTIRRAIWIKPLDDWHQNAVRGDFHVITFERHVFDDLLAKLDVERGSNYRQKLYSLEPRQFTPPPNLFGLTLQQAANPWHFLQPIQGLPQPNVEAQRWHMLNRAQEEHIGRYLNNLPNLQAQFGRNGVHQMREMAHAPNTVPVGVNPAYLQLPVKIPELRNLGSYCVHDVGSLALPPTIGLDDPDGLVQLPGPLPQFPPQGPGTLRRTPEEGSTNANRQQFAATSSAREAPSAVEARGPRDLKGKGKDKAVSTQKSYQVGQRQGEAGPSGYNQPATGSNTA